jgi:hypothetical protein
MDYDTIVLNQEMVAHAATLEDAVRVNRTVASEVDTFGGILGEFAFAEWFYGDWRRHQVGANKGDVDFPELGVEIKTSVYPFSVWLNLLVREDYAATRSPDAYVQVILDAKTKVATDIPVGTLAYICGWATSAEVSSAPKKDMGSKVASRGGYLCHKIPIRALHPMKELRDALDQG